MVKQPLARPPTPRLRDAAVIVLATLGADDVSDRRSVILRRQKQRRQRDPQCGGQGEHLVRIKVAYPLSVPGPFDRAQGRLRPRTTRDLRQEVAELLLRETYMAAPI